MGVLGKAYIVMGESGAYESHHVWVVGASMIRQDADRSCKMLQESLARLGLDKYPENTTSEEWLGDVPKKCAEMRQIDSEFSADPLYPSSYWVEETAFLSGGQ